MHRTKSWQQLETRWASPKCRPARALLWRSRAWWGDHILAGSTSANLQCDLGSSPVVFVIGHYRSGTTALQHLLAQTPGWTTLTYFDALFPEQFNGSRQRWQRPLQRLTTLCKARDPIQNRPWDWSYAAEDDVALCQNFCAATPAWAHVFMDHSEQIFADSQTEAAQAQWWRDYSAMLGRLQRARPHQVLVAKSPPHMTRLKLLHKKCPEARFVWIHRDPKQVQESQVRLWQTMQKTAVHELSDHDLRRTCASVYAWMEDQGQRQRRLLPSEFIYDLEQQELRSHPQQVRQQISSWLAEAWRQ